MSKIVITSLDGVQVNEYELSRYDENIILDGELRSIRYSIVLANVPDTSEIFITIANYYKKTVNAVVTIESNELVRNGVEVVRANSVMNEATNTFTIAMDLVEWL